MRSGLSDHFLKTAFPEADGNIGLSLSSETIRDAGRKFLDAHYPDCVCAFLFGSAIRGDLKEWSDMDLLVVTPTVEFPEKRCQVFEGLLFDHYLYDPNVLASALEPERGWAGPILTFGILSGHQITEPCVEGEKVVQLAKLYAQSRGPLETDCIALRKTRAKATSIMIELATNQVEEEATHCATELYDLLTANLVRQNIGFFMGTKWNWKILKSIRSDVCKEISCQLGRICIRPRI